MKPTAPTTTVPMRTNRSEGSRRRCGSRSRYLGRLCSDVTGAGRDARRRLPVGQLPDERRRWGLGRLLDDRLAEGPERRRREPDHERRERHLAEADVDPRRRVAYGADVARPGPQDGATDARAD